MTHMEFSPTATRAFAARILRRCIEGPIALAVASIVALLVLLEDVREQTFSHMAVAVLLLVFTSVIIRQFITDMLENDDRTPLSKTNAACLLTSGILRNLSLKATTSYELLRTVVATDRGKFILNEMGLPPERLLDVARPVIEKERIAELLAEAGSTMRKLSGRRIDEGTLLLTLFQRKDVFQMLLHALDLSVADMAMIVKWESYHHDVWKKDKFWSPAYCVKTFGGMGRRWVTGYNDVLDAITEDISQSILYRGRRKVVIHLDKLTDAIRILSRSSQHNVIITGEDGCGKRTLVENLAYQLRLEESKKGYAYTRVLILKAQDLLSSSHDPDAVLLQALRLADRQGRFILVIENIGLFLQSGDEKIAGVLSKFLQAKNINIIGIADTKDYHKYIKVNPALDNQFETLLLEPTAYDDTVSVVMEEYFAIEDRKHMHVTYAALKAIVKLADRYISKGVFPGKAIDLLYEAVSHAKERKDTYVTEGDVRAMVSVRAHMDVSGVDDAKKEALRTLDERMCRSIVGQRSAIIAICNALKRASSDIADRKRPIGTFLFLGPTGVGKTQTAKTLAEKYFGSEASMIRLDMNEYSSPDSIHAVIGSTDPRYPSEGFLTRAVQDKPFSLLLLDEIEKADKKVQSLFLQILDEGHLIDGQGVKTDFRNTIIIATSNAGAPFIIQYLKAHPEPKKQEFKKALLDELIASGSFAPEFLNRFDEVVLYQPLTEEETIQVAMLMIGFIVRDLKEKKGIAVRMDEDALDAISRKGYSAEFGAREMRRVITDSIETYVANYMLNHDTKRGDSITIRKADLAL